MTILERYVDQHPRSQVLHQRALRLFPNGVTHDMRHQSPFPIYVDRAQGSRKWDVDGNEIIDFVMGHGSLLLGHSYPSTDSLATSATPPRRRRRPAAASPTSGHSRHRGGVGHRS